MNQKLFKDSTPVFKIILRIPNVCLFLTVASVIAELLTNFMPLHLIIGAKHSWCLI
jgi:hypothetical protein